MVTVGDWEGNVAITRAETQRLEKGIKKVWRPSATNGYRGPLQRIPLRRSKSKEQCSHLGLSNAGIGPKINPRTIAITTATKEPKGVATKQATVIFALIKLLHLI